MFEKEAEDSFKCKKVLFKWETDKNSYIKGFKDGATFGYNKAKEEMQEQGLALQSDMDKTIEQNIALKKQIEKMKSCSNCIHYSSTFGLCHYSMGDEDYDCRGRKWEIKENANLEEKISILLSCKNCPENKGGLLCQKEYEDKCLSQKIQYIKELKEENTELKDKLNNLSKVAEVRLANWQKYEQENAELKEKIEKLKCRENCRFSIFDTDDLCVVGCNAGKCFNHEKWELQEDK